MRSGKAMRPLSEYLKPPALALFLLGATQGCAAGKDLTPDSGSDSDSDSGIAGARALSIITGGVLDLVALDPETGTETWRAAAGTTYNALHAADGVVYALEQDSDFTTIAYDLATGSELFRAVGDDEDLTPGPLVTDGVLITGWDRNTVAGLALTAPQTPAWTFEAAASPVGQAAIVAGLYVFGDGEGHVYALDPSDGAVAWEADLGGAVIGGIVATEDSAFTSVVPSTVVRLDGDTGAVSWSADVGPGNLWGLVDVGGERVYASTDDGVENLMALDRGTGAVAWRVDHPTYGPDGGVRLTALGILVPTYGHVTMFDADDGTELWTAVGGSAALTLPMVWDDGAYFSGAGTFTKLDLETGAVDWTLDDRDLFSWFAAPSILLDDGRTLNATDTRE